MNSHCSFAMGFCQKKGQGVDFLISLMEFEKIVCDTIMVCTFHGKKCTKFSCKK